MEIEFLVEDDPEGGFLARALGEPIYTDAETLESLRANIREAVYCHFADERARPKLVRLHHVRDEVMAL